MHLVWSNYIYITVKIVYKDHVFLIPCIQGWSYVQVQYHAKKYIVYPWEPVKCGRYKQVALIMQVVFRAGLTVFCLCSCKQWSLRQMALYSIIPCTYMQDLPLMALPGGQEATGSNIQRGDDPCGVASTKPCSIRTDCQAAHHACSKGQQDIMSDIC